LGSYAFHAPEGAFSAKYGYRFFDLPLEFDVQLGSVASAFDVSRVLKQTLLEQLGGRLLEKPNVSLCFEQAQQHLS
jgi:hypothetical protein